MKKHKDAILFTNNRGKVIELIPTRAGYKVLNPSALLYMDTVMAWWVDSYLKPL